MAKLRAFPKGSTEPVEWTLKATEEADVESLTASLLGKNNRAVGAAMTVLTEGGVLQFSPEAYAALEIVK